MPVIAGAAVGVKLDDIPRPATDTCAAAPPARQHSHAAMITNINTSGHCDETVERN